MNSMATIGVQQVYSAGHETYFVKQASDLMRKQLVTLNIHATIAAMRRYYLENFYFSHLGKTVGAFFL